MTKQRPPLSFEAALLAVAGQVGGWDEVAGLVGRSPSSVRNWSDPDSDTAIPISCALKLDRAFIAAGGDHAPFLACYQRLIELDGSRARGGRDRLVEGLSTFAREAGQAVEAGLRATLPGATDGDRIAAQREAEEASVALTGCLAQLTGAAPAPSPGFIPAPGPEVPARRDDPHPDSG